MPRVTWSAIVRADVDAPVGDDGRCMGLGPEVGHPADVSAGLRIYGIRKAALRGHHVPRPGFAPLGLIGSADICHRNKRDEQEAQSERTQSERRRESPRPARALAKRLECVRFHRCSGFGRAVAMGRGEASRGAGKAVTPRCFVTGVQPLPRLRTRHFEPMVFVLRESGEELERGCETHRRVTSPGRRL